MLNQLALSDIHPDHITYAKMALLAYDIPIKQEDIPADWQVLLDSNEIQQLKTDFEKNGFRGVAFCKDDCIIISIRGTDNWQNLKDDKHLFFSQDMSVSTIGIAARKFLSQINFQPYTKKIFTGHSLGGAVTEMLAYAQLDHDENVLAVTFDSPGFKLITPNDDKKPNFTHYLSETNIINSCHPHIGEVRRLLISFEGNTIDTIRSFSRAINSEHSNNLSQNPSSLFQTEPSTLLIHAATTATIEKGGAVNDLKKSHSMVNILAYLENGNPHYVIEATHFSQKQHVIEKAEDKVTENSDCCIM